MLRKAIRSALKRAQRKAQKLETELAACAEAEMHRQAGELIKANLAAVERGMDSVTLSDLFHPGGERVIALDPCLKPMDNARRYFKRYRKLTRGEERIRKQLTRCGENLTALEDLQQRLAAWEEETEPDVSLPPELAEEAERLGLHLPGLDAQPEPKAAKAPPRGVRVFTSRDGMTIYVGKGARENDELTLRIARGNEWWFHVQQYHGSHVVVRGRYQPGGDEKAPGKRGAKENPMPQETLLDAAHLAVHFSKARGATRAEVTYTQAKNVRKRRKSPPGQVIAQNARTLSLRVEETRLARLLGREG